MEFIIISGLSGAGKSSAAAFLEDLGFLLRGQYACGPHHQLRRPVHGRGGHLANTAGWPWSPTSAGARP
ncbi:MAG: RNase adapter RapZ [Evtepia gabavorous]